MSDLKSLMAREPKLRLALAESLTSGRLQALVGTISGASDFFAGGVTAYSLEQKVTLLGVDRAAAEAVNCVSRGVAEQMARGACALFNAGIAVATTGYAEPWQENGMRREPFAWWAAARRRPDGSFALISGTADFPGMGRAEVQERVARLAYDALVGWLRETAG